MTDRALLTKRLRAVKQDDEATSLLLTIWPAGLKISTATDKQLTEIERAIRTVEQEHNLSFEPFEPDTQPFETPPKIEPPPAIDEGEKLETAELDGIKAVIATLDDANAAFIEQVAVWCNEAGLYIGFVNHPTRRRAEIAKALIHLSSLSIPDAFDLIATVTGCDDHAEVGDVVGTLTIAQARVLQMADTSGRGE